MGGLATSGDSSGGCFLLPAFRLLVAPGLPEGLHAVGTVVLPVALPACIHLILALVIRAAGGPLAAQGLGGVGVGVVLTKANLLNFLGWQLREG